MIARGQENDARLELLSGCLCFVASQVIKLLIRDKEWMGTGENTWVRGAEKEKLVKNIQFIESLLWPLQSF